MNFIGIFCIFVAALISAAGNLLIRYSVMNFPLLSFNTQSLLALIRSPTLMGGMFLYLFAMVFWIKALSIVPLSQAHPLFTALLFIIILFGSSHFFAEPVGIQKIFGCAVILMGILIIVRT